MYATVTKTFRFEGAHQLLNHDGKCSRPHGHSYRVIVGIHGLVNTEVGHPKEGMVIDFADIKTIWKNQMEPQLDHQDLNQTLGIVTTAENIATWIGRQFRGSGLDVDWVEVWETETSCARVTNGDLIRG